MLNFLTISTDTTSFPWKLRTPFAAIPALLVVALTLSVGAATGHESAGAIAATSAFVVGFAVFYEALTSTLLSMGILTLGIASATLIGSWGAEWTPAVLALTLVAAINYGLLSDLGRVAGWMGQQCAVFAIIAADFPLGVHYAVGRASMVLLGGALQMAIYAALQLVQSHPSAVAAARFRVRLRRRLATLWVQLRNETHLRAETRSYILRLAVTLLLCTAIYRHFQLRNGYWCPMTAVLVLKPRWTETLSRGIARLVGTLLGVGIAVVLALYMPHPQWLIFVLVMLCAWLCYTVQAVNYALFSLFITLFIVFSFRFGGFSQTAAAHIRLFNTALGGAIALLLDALWLAFSPKHRRNFVQ